MSEKDKKELSEEQDPTEPAILPIRDLEECRKTVRLKRRAAQRVDVTLAVSIMQAGQEIAATVPATNLSGSGILVKTDVAIDPGSSVELRFTINGHEMITPGKVVDHREVSGGRALAIKFEKLSPRDRRRIEEFVFKCLKGCISWGVI